jgi:hypothetical protein
MQQLTWLMCIATLHDPTAVMGSQAKKLTHHNAANVCPAAVRLLHDAPAAAGSSSDGQAGRSSSHSQGDGVQWPGGAQRHHRPAAAVLLEAARLQHAEVGGMGGEAVVVVGGEYYGQKGWGYCLLQSKVGSRGFM